VIRLLAELRRRKVFRVAGIYAAACWLIVQVADVSFGAFELPGWAMRALIATLLLGFPVALALSWAFDLTPLGLRRAAPAEADATPLRVRWADYLVLGSAVFIVGFLGLRLWRTHVSPVESTPRAAQERGGAGDAASTAERPAAETRPAVAVLGFRNTSGRADTAWLSTAVGEMLATELGAGGRLRAVPGERVASMRIDLQVVESDTYTSDTLARMRRYLGADLVVFGSYAAIGEAAARRLRIDVRLQDARSGQTLALIDDIGGDDALFEMVSRLGTRLRQALGLDTLSDSEAAALRASEPDSADAARLYAEGLAKLRAFDAQAARDVLEDAAREAPHAPMIRRALSEAWDELGYSARSKDEAQRALDDAGALGRQEKLLVEGRLYEAGSDWSKAIETYRALFTFFPDNVDYGLRLANAQRHGDAASALETLARLREMTPGSGLEAAIDLAEAQAHSARTDFSAARASAERAIEHGNALGMRQLVANAKIELGNALLYLNEPAQARTILSEARDELAAAGNQSGAVRAATMIGIVETRVGERAAARARFEEVLALARSIGNEADAAFALSNLANLTQEEGKLVEAEDLYQQTLASNRRTGSLAGEAGTLGNLASVAQYRGELAESERLHQESIELYRKLGMKLNVSIELNNIGNLLEDQGKLAEARKAFEEALALKREVGSKRSIAYALNNLGEVLRFQDDLEGSRRALEEALVLRMEVGEQPNVLDSRLSLARLVFDEGRFEDSASTASELVGLYHTSGDEMDEADTRTLLARADLALGRVAEARSAIDPALALAEHVDFSTTKLTVAIAASEVTAREGHPDAALAALKAIEAEATHAGLAGVALDARLAAAGIGMANGGNTKAADEARVLAEDARANGFQLVARRAQALVPAAQAGR
jgi:tetratricopeptide (TPR) repeat protein